VELGGGKGQLLQSFADEGAFFAGFDEDDDFEASVGLKDLEQVPWL
jgi:hypothetical protein